MVLWYLFLTHKLLLLVVVSYFGQGGRGIWSCNSEIVSFPDSFSPRLFLFWSLHLVHMPLQVPTAYEQKLLGFNWHFKIYEEKIGVEALGESILFGIVWWRGCFWVYKQSFTVLCMRFSFIKEKHRRLMHAMVNYMDEEIGEMIDLLKVTGKLDEMPPWKHPKKRLKSDDFHRWLTLQTWNTLPLGMFGVWILWWPTAPWWVAVWKGPSESWVPDRRRRCGKTAWLSFIVTMVARLWPKDSRKRVEKGRKGFSAKPVLLDTEMSRSRKSGIEATLCCWELFGNWISSDRHTHTFRDSSSESTLVD